MSNINDYLDYISTANYGSDVREAIVSSIRECYKDATGHPDSVAALVQEYIDREESIDDKVSLLTGLYNSLGEIVYSYDYNNNISGIHITENDEFGCVDQITLGPGKWIIKVVSWFAIISNASPDIGIMYLSFSNTLDSDGFPIPLNDTYNYKDDSYSGTILNSSGSHTHFVKMIELTEERTIYMWIKHTGRLSSDIVVSPHMTAMKIGESTPSDGTSLVDQVVENTEDIVVLEGKVATNISDISTLDGDVSTLQDDVNDIEDEITDIKADLNDVKNLDDFNILAGIQWENKSVSTTNGAEFNSSTRILSDFIDISNVSKIEVSVNNGYRYIYHLYDENKNWLSYHGGWQTTSQTILPSAPYIKFVVSKPNDAQISPSESVNFYAEGMFPFNDFVNNISTTFESLSFNIPIMRDGTIGNIGNVNGITTEYVIPIPKRYDFVMVEWTGYDITENEDVGFGYCVYDGASDGMTSAAAFTSSAVTKHNYNSGLTKLTDTPPIKYISLDDLRAEGQHYGICVFRKENESFVPLRIATDQYSLKLTYGYYENNKIDTSILSLNPDIQDRLLQANRPLNTSANAYLSVAKPVTLLHFSDIHGDVTELKRMVDLRASFSSMIDDAICTGDMVEQRYSNGMSWWASVSGSENILMAIGNHDALSDPTGFDWTQLATQAQQYSQYFSPYISNWGATYTANKTYYYKDYSAKKIRLVVLNCMLTGSDDTDQQTWLTSTLASAKTAGLSVVIAVHYMPYNPQKIGCNFSSLDKGVGSDVLSLVYLTIVQNFIDAGGEFICYIAGHVHYDIFVKSTTYPNQLCICIDALSAYQSNVYSDTQRTNGTKSQDLANLITFDTASKVVKISRVGADQDHYLRSKKFMTFKYLAGDIITEN